MHFAKAVIFDLNTLQSAPIIPVLSQNEKYEENAPPILENSSRVLEERSRKVVLKDKRFVFRK